MNSRQEERELDVSNFLIAQIRSQFQNSQKIHHSQDCQPANKRQRLIDEEEKRPMLNGDEPQIQITSGGGGTVTLVGPAGTIIQSLGGASSTMRNCRGNSSSMWTSSVRLGGSMSMISHTSGTGQSTIIRTTQIGQASTVYIRNNGGEIVCVSVYRNFCCFYNILSPIYFTAEHENKLVVYWQWESPRRCASRWFDCPRWPSWKSTTDFQLQ